MEMNSLKFRLIAIFLIFSLISVTSHKCGTQNYAAQFLVGAETAEDGQFPWKVAIFKNDDDQFLCGGSVIGQQHVLTAAHCILPNVQLKIQLGQHHLNITSKNSQTRFVESASIYKSYKASAKSSEGDIAIIKMDRKVEFNDFITPICLPRSNTSVESSFGTVVGHGQSENNSPELIPRFAELQTVSQEECYRNHHVLSTLITSNTFCAGGNGIGPCRGDSGGGFMLKDARVKQWTVVGVVSKGVLSNVGCNANNYVVFMKVFVEDVLNWILELVKDASFASVSLNFNITGFTEPASKLVPNTISKWSWMPKFVQPDLAFYINEGTIIDNLGYVIAHDKNLKVTDFKTKNNPGIEYLPILVDRKFPNLKVYKGILTSTRLHFSLSLSSPSHQMLSKQKFFHVKPQGNPFIMDGPSTSDIVLLHGNSHPELANLIGSRLNIKSSGCSVYHKSNRETMVDIGDSVRGKNCYIIQTGTKDCNNNIMELLIMAYACKTSSAKSIVAVIPYLPYSKQCKMRKRGSIVTKLIAKMMCNAGLTHVITMDLHQKEIQGFFDCPVDNLRASPFLLQYIQDSIPDYRNAVIVARNPGSAKKATSYAERLRLGIAVIHGEQKVSEADEVDGRNSPPNVPRARMADISSGFPSLVAKEKPPINVVGDVGGRIAVIVDDLIDEVQSFVSAAEVLKERGAYKIYVLATHGLLSSDAPRLIEDSHIDEVVVTNTIPHEIQKMQCHKIKTVDISILLSEAIRRIHNKESMSHLFKNVTLED